MGIEPTYPAWEASVLPLNYTRKFSDRVKCNLLSGFCQVFSNILTSAGNSSGPDSQCLSLKTNPAVSGFPESGNSSARSEALLQSEHAHTDRPPSESLPLHYLPSAPGKCEAPAF